MSCNCGPNPQTNNCENPCQASVTNTPACESLPSQIQNFSDQFFGPVVKTEIDGRITWSLPCSLDVGLPANPRAADEGVACYFLRLFSDGIVGLKGDPGEDGTTGATGLNAYSVTIQSFAQPTAGAPNVIVLTAANPAIIAGMYVFITNSGHYFVNAVDPSSGALNLTLTKATVSPATTITAGKLVVPSGYPGNIGPQGEQGIGIKGDPGTPGVSFTVTNANYFATVGIDYPLPAIYAAVDFTNSQPNVVLAAAGTYLVTVCVAVVGKPTVNTVEVASFKLQNTSTATDIGGTEKHINSLLDTSLGQLVINALVTTTGTNQTISLFGKCTTNAAIDAVALNTTITAVRIA